ncbi:Muramoyltetrapeptide carboxypeptidase LdcA (peptidoglycan recycling) [Pelagirhabdus alkalitolerans]|uniref:Muramoyltetrapeptide carboxypeptidase LdcA (Peptidoglycan recycling) n=1 Tax=Pelagirhabdus alkalitolerans TaxID=1612202 RepID=A0A1G6IK54_9BACI|nr:S66 peptidase family protein [Pelagirhabdus alkalitolerans]SDC06909.1 Muramoyltetrapeptide carboxypeptidase LdcA (peptidoglycan recycling) [Pelagirhabdus alkalitolerans]
MLKKGDRVGWIACSDGKSEQALEQVDLLKDYFHKAGLNIVQSNAFKREPSHYWSAPPEVRARELMNLFIDDQIAAIFDLSGGDSANEILPYLDFDKIRKHPKPFFGYSDVSVLLNALYHKADIMTYHFQALHLAQEASEIPSSDFLNVLNQTMLKPTFDYHFINGDQLEGTVMGGNIRCFLKLAGTPYMPDSKGKMLFLESRSGQPNRIASFFNQLDQMGYFEEVSGVLLGTFTELETEYSTDRLIELMEPFILKHQLVVAKTDQIGHQLNSRLLPIGQKVKL